MRRQPNTHPRMSVIKPENGRLRKTFRFTPEVQAMLEFLMQQDDAPHTENAMVQACIVLVFQINMVTQGLIDQNPEYLRYLESYKGKRFTKDEVMKFIDNSVAGIAEQGQHE